MFRKFKNFITRHKHSFELEEIETSYHFVRTGIMDSYTDNSFFGGTTFLYEGYWERIIETTELCQCGQHGEVDRQYKKVRELSNGARIIEIMNDLALHGQNSYTSTDKERRVKVSMNMQEARKKLHGILMQSNVPRLTIG